MDMNNYKNRGVNQIAKQIKFALKQFVVYFGMIMPLALLPMANYGMPAGSEVVQGNVAIDTSIPNQTVINSTTDKSIINWQSYNVGTNETVRYNQPGATSISLNRVVGGSPSQILGTISSNGRVWLVNPAGIWFGPSSMVNVAGLLATTANITDSDFMNGQYNFSGSSNAAITNEGQIYIHSAGLAAFVGTSVTNNGVIQADMGAVVLGASKVYTVDFSGDQLINFAVGGDVDQLATDHNGNLKQYAVENNGTIIANGGKVNMHAAVAGNVLNQAINMTGVIEAKSVGMQNGSVVLGGNAGTVKISGKINVSGKGAGQKGGKVKITGNRIAMLDTASIDASGSAGGGEVLIGGDYLGSNAAIQNAQYVVFSKNAVVNADAIDQGDGGKVIVWSNEGTQYYGTIYARGGLQGGNGGFIETSGKDFLTMSGIAYANAYNGGTAGLWLLDPSNVLIQAAATANGTFDGGDPNIFTPNADNSVVNTATIIAALEAGTSVTILSTGAGSQAGNITVVDPITVNSGTTPVTLTLSAATPNPVSADSQILISANINATGGPALNVTLTNAGNIVIDPGVSIITNGGDFSATAQLAGGTTVNGTINTGSGGIAFTGNSAFINGFLFSTGAINFALSANVLTGVGAQIGGTGVGTGRASSVIFQANTGGFVTDIGVAGGAGTYEITADILNSVRTVDLTIGGAGNTGAVTIDSLVFGAGVGEVNTSVLTGDLSFGSAVGITVTNALDLSATTSDVTFNLGREVANPAELTFNAGSTVNAGSNDITITTLLAANDGTSAIFNNSQVYSTGTITINTDIVTATAGGQIGGTAVAGTFAQNIIYFPETTTQDISLNNAGAGAGNLSPTLLSQLFTTNLRIGSTTGPITGGDINISTAWTLGANFNGGVLSLNTTGAIADGASGAIIMPTTMELLLRNASSVTLNNATNEVRRLAADIVGGLTLVNASTVPLLITTATDDIGAVAGLNLTNLTVTTSGAGGTITQNQAILSAGTANLSSGANAITLTNASNDFGTIALTNTGANNISIRDVDGLIFGSSSVGGDLTVVTDGQMTQTAALVVAGTTTLTAGVANNITLANVNNDFSTVDVVNGNNISIRDTNALTVESIPASGSLTVQAGGLLTINGVQTAAGDILLRGQGITVNNVNITASGTGTVELDGRSADGVTTGALTLGTGSISAGLSATGSTAIYLHDASSLALNNITAIGVANRGFTIENISGATTQTVGTNINVVDAYLLNNGDITLDTFTNNFDALLGDLTITAGANVDIVIYDNSNVIFDNVSLGLNTTLETRATGFISQTSGTTVTAAAGTIVSLFSGQNGGISGPSSITLSEANNFAGRLNLDATLNAAESTAIVVNDINALNLGTIVTPTTLTVTTAGAITQSGSATVTGASSFSSGGSAITLTNAANNFGGAVSLSNTGPNNIAITDANALILGTVTAGQNLTVTASGAITQTGIITSAGAASFTAGAGAITLTNASNDFGGGVGFSNSGANNISVVDVNDLAINTSSVGTGTLTVTSGGIITQNGAITQAAAAGAATFNATLGITLDAANDFTGAVGMNTTSNNATVNDINSIILGPSTLSSTTNPSNLIVTANGAITQTGVLNVSNDGVTLTAGAGNDITLTNVANNVLFFRVVSGNNVSLVNSGSLLFAAATSTISGNFTATALGGNIGQAGAGTIIIANNPGTLSTFSATGAISLVNASNDFNEIRVTGATNAAFTDVNALVLNTLSMTGNLTLITGGAVTQTGAATIGGTSSVSAGANAITLTNAANNFTGAVSLSNSGANNVAVTDVNALVLGTVSVGQNLTANAGGAITQTGVITVPGTSSFTAGANAITLTNASNNFTGAVSVSNSGANNVAITDTNALILGTVSIGQNLAVIANGNITQTSALVLPGTASFAAGAGAITLTNAANDFNGAVSLSNTGANNVSIVDLDNLIFGNVNVGTGTFNATAIGMTQAVGTTMIQALGAGAVTLNSQTGSINLTNAGNQFRGTVLMTANGVATDASLTNSVGLTTGKITATGDVNLTTTSGNIFISDEIDPVDVNIVSAGTITQAMVGVIIATGTLTTSSVGGTILDATNFAANVDMTNSGSGNIELVNQAATLGITAINQTGGDTIINNTGGIDVNGAVSSSGAVTLVASTDFNLLADVTSNAAGDAIQLVAGTTFTYTSGNLITTGGGRYLVWSIDPTLDTNQYAIPNAYNFVQYNATYPGTPVAQSTGNGLLYQYAPTLNPILVGNVTKVYDGTTTVANLTSANYSYNNGGGATGPVAGDVVTVTGPTTGTYAQDDVGVNIGVTSDTPLVGTAVDINGATVYGYQFVVPNATGNIGTITPRPLTVTGLTSPDAPFNATNPTAIVNYGGAVLNNLIGGDTVSLLTGGASAIYSPNQQGSAVPIIVSGLAISGVDSGNYTLIQPTLTGVVGQPTTPPWGEIFPIDTTDPVEPWVPGDDDPFSDPFNPGDNVYVYDNSPAVSECGGAAGGSGSGGGKCTMITKVPEIKFCTIKSKTKEPLKIGGKIPVPAGITPRHP